MEKRGLFRFAKLTSIALTIAAASSSCTKPDINFGAEYLDNNYTNIVAVDTSTVLLSTVYIDSFVTSASGKAVVGKYIDPYFGTIDAQSYFPLIPPAYSDIYKNTTFDSLVLIMKPNKSYYGDTSQLLNISVYQLATTIEFGTNETQLYNVSKVPAILTALASTNIRVKPNVTENITIRLPDSKGNELLTLFQNRDATVQSSSDFINYFKGLNITSNASSSMMLGFSDSITMRLYYKSPGVVVEQKYIDFTLADNTKQFNNINVDRSGTLLSTLGRTNKEIPSSASGNIVLGQTITGSIIKLQFPYLKDFLYNSRIVKIVRAELEIQPVKNSFNSLYPLPPQLRLSTTTQDNILGTDLSYQESSGSWITDYGNLSIDNLYGENTSYIYNVTDYINAQIRVTVNNKNGLLLSAPAPAFQSDFNRVVLADKSKGNGKVQLRLYYVSVSK